MIETTEVIILTRTQEVVMLHEEINAAMKISLPKAIRIGEILTEQKSEAKHGEWLSFVKAKLPFTDQTARNYMRCFDNRDKIKSVLNLNEAYKMLQPSKPHTELKHQNIQQDIINYLDVYWNIAPTIELEPLLLKAIEFERDLNNFIFQHLGFNLPWKFPVTDDLRNIKSALIMGIENGEDSDTLMQQSYSYTERFHGLINEMLILIAKYALEHNNAPYDNSKNGNDATHNYRGFIRRTEEIAKGNTNDMVGVPVAYHHLYQKYVTPTDAVPPSFDEWCIGHYAWRGRNPDEGLFFCGRAIEIWKIYNSHKVN